MSEHLKVQFDYVHPPIPVRKWDYRAWVELSNGDEIVAGWGESPSGALCELARELDDNCIDIAPLLEGST